MPAYSNANPPFSVERGSQQAIVNAEVLGAGNFSSRVAIADKDTDSLVPVTVTFTYASTPAAVQYDIYVAWDDALATYTKVGTTNNVNGDQVTIQRVGAGGINFRFLCVKEVVSPGVNATVQVRK
jgi:hypothetical protein